MASPTQHSPASSQTVKIVYVQDLSVRLQYTLKITKVVRRSSHTVCMHYHNTGKGQSNELGLDSENESYLKDGIFVCFHYNNHFRSCCLCSSQLNFCFGTCNHLTPPKVI